MLTAGTLVVSLRILHGKKAHCLMTKQGLYRPLNVADFKVGNTDFNISRMVDSFNLIPIQVSVGPGHAHSCHHAREQHAQVVEMVLGPCVLHIGMLRFTPMSLSHDCFVYGCGQLVLS